MYLSQAKRRTCRKPLIFLVLLLLSFILLFNHWSLRTRDCNAWSPLRLAPYCSTSEHGFNLFYHLGGNGPWIPRRPHGPSIGEMLPGGCSVDQVHMMSRHAERYPTRNAGARQLALLAKLKQPAVRLTGSFAFVSEWVYFTDLDDPNFENLTNSGPFSGTLQAHTAGQKLETKYKHLVKTDRSTKFWSCSSPRDVETARHFARGFFGETWESSQSAELHIIPETAERGADTLTPGDTCLKYRDDKIHGHDYGYSKLSKWQSIFSQRIEARLKADTGGLTFTSLEIYGMMEMCGFEILVRGSSPWCDVFTQQEWLEFEYARDLLHFYRAGPGNQYAAAMGYLWLDATRKLLTNNSAGGVYFSFVHDGDIIPLVTTMGLLHEPSNVQTLPVDRIQSSRRWKTSDVVPMGGRLVFERVTCDHPSIDDSGPRSYVRLFINDDLFDLEGLIGGSGLAGATELEKFQGWVLKKGKEFGDFRTVCGLAEDAPAHISFLHQ